MKVSDTTNFENELASSRKKKLKFDDEEQLIFKLSPYSKKISKRLYQMPKRPRVVVPPLDS